METTFLAAVQAHPQRAVVGEAEGDAVLGTRVGAVHAHAAARPARRARHSARRNGGQARGVECRPAPAAGRASTAAATTLRSGACAGRARPARSHQGWSMPAANAAGMRTLRPRPITARTGPACSPPPSTRMPPSLRSVRRHRPRPGRWAISDARRRSPSACRASAAAMPATRLSPPSRARPPPNWRAQRQVQMRGQRRRPFTATTATAAGLALGQQDGRALLRGRTAQQFGVGRVERPGHLQRSQGRTARIGGRPARIAVGVQQVQRLSPAGSRARPGPRSPPRPRAAPRSASTPRPGSARWPAPAHRPRPALRSAAAAMPGRPSALPWAAGGFAAAGLRAVHGRSRGQRLGGSGVIGRIMRERVTRAAAQKHPLPTSPCSLREQGEGLSPLPFT